MKTKKHKITLVLLVVLALFAYAFPAFVYADDKDNKDAKDNKDDKCKQYIDKNVKSYADKYGLKIDSEKSEEENNVIISMNIPKDSGLSAADKKAAVFKIAKIEIGRVADDGKDHLQQTFTTDQLKTAFGIDKTTLKNGEKIVFPHPYDSEKAYYVTLEPVDYQDADIKKVCGDNSKFTIEISADIYEKPKVVMSGEVEQLYSQVDFSPAEGKKIDCTKPYDPASFENNYCQILNKAIETKNMHTVKWGSGFDEKDVNNFKCDVNKVIKSQEVLNDDALYYLEENRKYMAATSETEINVGKYVYNYAYSDTDHNKVIVKEEEEVKCKKACTEAIKVEYGAPVASKAGLCFEYKVKVTSYVNCELTESPKAPNKKKSEVCTPVPGCNHGSGYVDTGAGPNSDFKACISKCDGGKFTKKCSTKCYKEVYEQKKNKKTSLLDTEELKAIKTKTAREKQKENNEWISKEEKEDKANKKDMGNDTIEHDYDHIGEGKYFVKKDGKTIIWNPASNLGRYYKETQELKPYWKELNCSKKSGQGGGIISSCGCSAECLWKGCTNKEGKVNHYLNPDDAEADAEENIKTYKVAKEKCKNEATCSTTTATFEISVDYKYGDGENKKKNISFPYSTSSTDSKSSIGLTNDGKGKVTCENPGGIDNTTLIESQGCYANSNCTMKERDKKYKANESNNAYMTEWTFPGTWQHVKTGEITYVKPNQSEIDDGVWIEKGNKYCIPLDQVEVNKKWWDKYYSILVTEKGTPNLEYSIADNNYINNIEDCKETSNGQNAIPANPTISESEIDYNIHASTKKFGYFHWNINVDCFYAVGKTPITESTKTTDKDGNPISCLGPASSSQQMKVRTVDLGNLFPGSGEEKLSNSSETGRTPGFNWSTFAEPKFTEADNSLGGNSYSSQIHPKDYLNYVQKNAYTIYNDDELDYDISLSKDQIKQLRSKVKDNNYTQYNGNSTTDSASHYESDLWNNDNLVTVHKHPTGAALKCNNLKSGQCFNVGNTN